ncbi:MAG: PAS domain S-box protein [Burkholderiaceae bacterium]|nr:PAS domain S-box protein [Burkholderiaceae bacterium]MDZ4145086.1 PAS domain S-box protein [Burkholderiales bacterium]
MHASNPLLSPSEISANLTRHYERAVGIFLKCLLVALPVLLAVSWSNRDTMAERLVVVLILTITVALYFVHRRGHTVVVIYTLIGSVVLTSALGIVAYGSVRSAGAFALVGAVAAAGIFLSRRGLAATVFLCVALLGALTWAEMHGLMQRDDMIVTPKVWILHTLVLVVIALIMYYSRQALYTALGEQRAILQQCEMVEQQLRASKAQLERVFENSLAAITLQSAQHKQYLKVNAAFEQVLGYRRDEFEGANAINFWYPPELRDQTLTKFEANGGRLVNEPARVRRKDGQVLDVRVSAELAGEGDDQVVVCIITDVSQEARAREQVLRSQELFYKAFNFSPLAKSITRESDGRFIEVNAAKEGTLGYRRDELLGHTTTEVGLWPTPDARAHYIEAFNERGRLTAHETQMRHKDGHLVPIREWAERIDLNGEACILSYSMDITEEKRREALLLNVAKGVSAETGESFFKAMVEQAARALGADCVQVGELVDPGAIQSRAVFMDGQPANNFWYPIGGSPCGDALHNAALHFVADGLDTLYPRSAVVTSANFKAYLGTALRDGDGTPVGVLCALWRQPVQRSADREALLSIFAGRTNAEMVRMRRDRDIQQLNETLEQRVRERTAELQALNAEMESFSYSVSHDLKSPLTTINGFTQMLTRQLGDRLTDSEQRLFQRILAATARMEQLTSDMLALARVSRSEVKLQNVDLGHLVRLIDDALRQNTPERTVQVIAPTGLVARCDPQLARIVLDNLVGNAWKYSRRQSVARIELGVLPARPDGRKVFFVKDNGVGFNMAYADKLFKPFHRLHGASEFEGTGIGLATVHRILERHGGAIECESAEGHGTTFFFTFDPPHVLLAASHHPLNPNAASVA